MKSELPRKKNPLLAGLFIAHLSASVILGSVFVLGWVPLFFYLIDLAFLKALGRYPGWYRYYGDALAESWFSYMSFLLETLCGTRMVFSGDAPTDRHESCVVISNHRTRLDWCFLWSWFERYGDLRHEKIVLKDPLKKVPGFGWAMQQFCFLFLRRRWEQDEAQIAKVLNHFVETKYPVQLLIFPEGTDFTPESVLKSEEFAKKSGVEVHKHLLLPRVKGFSTAVMLLRPQIKAIYDITLGYPDVIPQTEKCYLEGRPPKEVHFHVRRFAVKDLPQDEEGLNRWCVERWREKENMLADFYLKKKPFPNPLPSSGVRTWQTFFYVLWMILIFSFAYLVWNYSLARYSCLIVAVTLTVLTKMGGTEHMEISTFSGHKKFHQQ